jgi:hypothetical protein
MRARVRFTGVVGTARRKGISGNVGGPAWMGVASPNPVESAAKRGLEKVIVPKKPGNAGGRKEPHFWNASEAVEEG